MGRMQENHCFRGANAMISLDLNLIVRELNIPADAFEKWKAASLESFAANDVALVLPLPEERANLNSSWSVPPE